MEIKKILFSVVCFVLLLAETGCKVPGTYLRTGEIQGSAKTFEGKLTNTKIVPINLCLLQKNTNKFISLNTSKTYPYYVGPNDVLNIVVWNHPELTMPTSQNALLGLNNSTQNPFQTSPSTTGITVTTNGEIFFPFAGNIQVAGKTTDQIERALTLHLTKYIKKPQVSVRVVAFNSRRINIIGEVQKPGVQALTNRPLSLLDAINTAGGIDNKIADSKHIYVFRNNMQNISIYWLNAKNPQSLLLAERFRLANNDIVYVAPAGLPSFNRIIAQLLPTLQTIWYTRSLIRE